MAGTNDITGDRLVGKGNNTEEYKTAWERTFGSKQKEVPFMWSPEVGATQVDCCGHCGLDSTDDKSS